MDVSNGLVWANQPHPLMHKPTANQMAARQDINWREVDLLDLNQTGMEPLSYGMVMDISGGPHSLEESPGYMSGYEERRVQEEHSAAGGQYVDADTYHAAAAALPQHIRAFIFHQAAPPQGWYDAAGNPRPGFGVWEPCDMILGTNPILPDFSAVIVGYRLGQV